MKIDENTKLIGRFHKIASPRGLNIYNHFFEKNKINAIYLLFYNDDPKVLIDGFRSLNLFGAITAGFESDNRIPKLIDGLDDVSKYLGKVGYLTSEKGKIIGHAQGGEGMLRTIQQVSKINRKHLVVIGAGNIAKGLMLNIKKQKLKPEVILCNRDVKKAQELKKDFNFIRDVCAFDQLTDLKGDVLINLTDVGGSVTDYNFDKKTINKYSAVVDVTFETENTDLVKKSKKLGKKVATGWDMFTNQGLVILEDMFNKKFDFLDLKKSVARGLSSTVK